MKIKNILVTMVAIMGLAACSAKGTVESLIPDIGNQPETPMTKEQALPDNMPEIENDAVYLGQQALVLGELQTLLVDTDAKYGVYDFEFIAQEDMSLFFDQLYSAHQGGCSEPQVTYDWINLQEDGELTSQVVVDSFTFFSAAAGERYVLRAYIKGFSECENANLGLKVNRSL